MESGPNLIRVGIAGAQAHAEGGVELTEDVQSLLPRAAGGGEVADGVLGVAEVGENHRLTPAVAEFPSQRQGLLEMNRRLFVAAEVVVSVCRWCPSSAWNQPMPFNALACPCMLSAERLRARHCLA